MSRLDLSKMTRSELEATVVSQAKLAERFRRSIANIALGIEDEGDRAYFGSTNDADELRELESALLDDLNILECPWMHGRDLHAELAALRNDRRELLEALEAILLAALSCDATKKQIADLAHSALAKARGPEDRGRAVPDHASGPTIMHPEGYSE